MNLSALADGQILTILSYLVETRPRYSNDHDDKEQKKEHDRFERRFKRSFPHSHAQMLDEKTMRREILRRPESYILTPSCASNFAMSLPTQIMKTFSTLV